MFRSSNSGSNDVWFRSNRHPATASQVTAQAIIDPATIYQAIDAALSERLDLTIIRQVVEAAVSQALTGLELTQESHVEDWVELPTSEGGILLTESGFLYE